MAVTSIVLLVNNHRTRLTGKAGVLFQNFRGPYPILVRHAVAFSRSGIDNNLVQPLLRPPAEFHQQVHFQQAFLITGMVGAGDLQNADAIVLSLSQQVIGKLLPVTPYFPPCDHVPKYLKDGWTTISGHGVLAVMRASETCPPCRVILSSAIRGQFD